MTCHAGASCAQAPEGCDRYNRGDEANGATLIRLNSCDHHHVIKVGFDDKNTF